MLGSVCGALMFAKMLQVTLLPYGIAALALSVWIIYTVDHLLDARNVKGSASATRHRFHQHHFKTLLAILLVAIAVVIVLLFFIRIQVLHGGLILIGAVALYLLLHRYLKIPKEMLISILYTCGVLLPSYMVTRLSFQEIPYTIVLMFMLSAFTNLLVFSWYDYEKDKRDGFRSVAITLGKSRTQIMVWLVGSIALVLVMLATDRIAAIIIFSVILIQLVLISFPSFFTQQESYRLLGDAAFMLPLLYLLL
ncbi:hypothetical protein SanaruYs_15200 [Chryseotalea sanaruensis]|uniref:Prenyltransferase n=2 Tax=Chryseotalea sanaruensis TaxID=2482724 RepID=A0A401U8V0_9BACT|nr:hypothetical protein SanaruYs_15200 [Chryseotalea sanaruensis]